MKSNSTKTDEKTILKIATDFFMKETGSEQETQQMLGGLAHLVKDQGAKLVHIDKMLFLILVRNAGVVEVRPIGIASDSEMAKELVALSKYLKNIGVKSMSLVSDEPDLKAVAKLTKLPFQNQQSGKQYISTLELK